MTTRCHGEGSITQRKDGRWQSSLMVNGIRRVAYGRTRQEAQRKLAELQRQAISMGALPDPGIRTVNDLLDRWFETITPRLKPATLEQYHLETDNHIRPALGTIKLAKVQPDRLQRLYSELQASGLGRTAELVHALLRQAFGLAVLWRWLPENPCDRVMRPTHHAARKELWNAWQLHNFLQGIQNHWLGPLWTVAIASGCRLGELTGLTWDDVSPIASNITIRQTLHRIGGEWSFSTPKTRAGERVLALPAEGLDALKRQQAQQAVWQAKAGGGWQAMGLVFTNEQGNPLHRATVAHAIQRECERLNLPALTPHGLRHLHASLLLAEGVAVTQVSRQLGHAHAGITMSVYAHCLGRGDGAVAQALENSLSRINHLREA
jgi:integrase